MDKTRLTKSLIKLYRKFLTKISKQHALNLYENKSKRKRIDDFLNIISKIKNKEATNQQAFDYLEELGISCKELPEHFIDEILANKVNSQAMLEKINRIPSVKFNYSSWLELSMILFALGCIRAALLCRIHSHRRVVSFQNKIIYSFIYPIIKQSAKFDSGRWNEKWNFSRNPYVQKLFRGKNEVGLKQDASFYNYIRGKSVAVIGPLASDPDYDYSEEIQKADIVVNVNMLYQRIEGRLPKYGRYPDIVYYNGKTATINERSPENLFSDDVRFWVFKRQYHKNHFSQFGIVPTVVIPSTNNVEYTGSFKMIESMVLHILLNDPGRLKIYDADLEYSLSYDVTYVEKDIKAIISDYYVRNTHHDSFTQYNLIKNLYEKGFVEVDRRLKSVLDMGIENYSKALEEKFL